ncbi:hypothetical protein TNCV_3268941 [Trichonephila clavipes]|nr:hypothetical protein TNCV_3268941 [Trichonephila clavipes]
MEESENDVGSLEKLLLYADEYYLAGKLPLGDHLGKVLHGVEEYHQRNPNDHGREFMTGIISVESGVQIPLKIRRAE